MGSSRRGGSGKDGFVHIAAVEKVGVDLREGDKVTYDVVPSKGKESAGEVKALIGRQFTAAG
jgi:cold shock CspA family protein